MCDYDDDIITFNDVVDWYMRDHDIYSIEQVMEAIPKIADELHKMNEILSALVEKTDI